MKKSNGGVFIFTLIKLQQRYNVVTVFCVVSAANLLGNFSVALTYDLFITLGLITAVPVSAGKKPLKLYVFTNSTVFKWC